MKKIFCLMAVVGLIGCQSVQEKTPEQLRTELEQTIEEKEKGVFDEKTKVLIPQKTNELIDFYSAYIENNPESDKNPGYIYNMGKLYMGLGQFEKSINTFERIVSNHPDWEKAANAAFNIAFIYDEHLEQKGKAGEMYDRVIEKYPSSAISNDARALKVQLNMTEEELIKFLESK